MTKTITGNVVLTNIFELMDAKGIRQKDLADFLGVSSNAITQWKLQRSRSYMNYIDQIAEYFNVTTNDLIHSNKKEAFEYYLSQDEQQLVRGYRILKTNSKTAVLNLINTLSEDYNKLTS
jgi:transcriptional regulator with XRE-family HTH domain